MLNLATIGFFGLGLLIGFVVGITFRGNPPKRTRKRKNQPAPHGQPEANP